MPDLVIHGLPTSLANDASWLDDSPDRETRTTKETRTQTVFAPIALLAVLLLIALADFLFWQHPIGISLALFSAGLCGAALTNLRPSFTKRDWLVFAAVWSLFALPVLEFVQVISVVILALGHASLLIWSATRSKGSHLARALMLLPLTFLGFAAVNSINIGIGLVRGKPNVSQSAITAWILPLTVGMVFMTLFIGANPVFQEWVNDLLNLDISPELFARVTFWSAAGFLILPFAMFGRFAQQLHPKAGPRRSTVKREGTLFNARSVQNSLVLFNAMFLLQNVTDLMVLWGNTGLPEGMTYATYAHSGAYPLMATSILAVLFALVSRRFTFGSEFIKTLLLVWVGQNVILLGSAIFRLDLYVDAYGLTFLRLRVSVGMFMVLAVMMLMIWQLWKAKSNAWLTGSCAVMMVSVLYTCSLVNFGYVIASQNLARQGKIRDTYYVCHNTLSGIKAVSAHYGATGEKLCLGNFKETNFRSDNWRGWSYRSARLENHRQGYLDATKAKPQTSDRQGTRPYETNEGRAMR